MRVVIANFGRPGAGPDDYREYWRITPRPERPERKPLFEYKVDWGFHIYALGIYLMEKGIADEVEFWNFSEDDGQPWHRRGMSYHYMGVLRVNFVNEADAFAYIERYGAPDLFINYGRDGMPLLEHLEGKSFRVHVPASRVGLKDQGNRGAECFLVDDRRYLDSKSMLYIPVVNTERIRPTGVEHVRDFVYLAGPFPTKRHDIVINAVRDREITGHFHPVPANAFELSGTRISTSDLNEVDIVNLLCSSRIAVYPGDETSNPASMWECVAAGLPIVVNRNIAGGRYVVVPGVTGELAGEGDFLDVMQQVIDNRHLYQPRRYFEEHWSTRALLDQYVDFFRSRGLDH